MRDMSRQTKFPTANSNNNNNGNGSRNGLGTPDIRQRASTSTSNQHQSPTYRDRSDPDKQKQSSTSTRHGEKDRKGKGKAKAKWEVGTKGWVKEGFRKFGEHCARNQIRTLLIDCLVMTNLFYPSLAVWYQKRAPSRTSGDIPHAGPSRLPQSRLPGSGGSSIWSTPLLDSFYPDPSPFLPPLDAGGWWEETDDTKDDPSASRWNGTRVARRRTSRHDHQSEEELRLVRVGWTDVDQIQQYRPGQDRDCRQQWSQRESDLLSAVQEVANTWEGDHPGSRERCVREWRFADLIEAEALAPCVEVATNPCGTQDHGLEAMLDSPSSAYRWTNKLFRLPRGSTDEFDRRWALAMQGIAEQQAGVTFVNGPSRPRSADPWQGEWDLSFAPETLNPSEGEDDETQKPENPYAKYFVLLYVAMFCILAFQVNFATRVHSKFGLAVTGIVQLCCSAIMSLSVLALIGWNGWGWSSLPSSVPIWVLPMVIVIVGVENMSTMTKAVFSVPFHYSVPERIGLGLSRSGMKILYTTLANIFALAIIWYFVDVVPVREFCLFAITVNITDWFMLHTFYLTVISIDAQRLELADVLATSGNQDPATQTVSIEESDDATSIFSWRGLLAGRMFRSGTLFLTLFCVGVIYLVTDRGTSSLSHHTSELYAYAKATATALPSSSPFATSTEALASMSKHELLWRAINPQNWPSVRITISAPSIIILPSPRNPITPKDILRLAEPISRAAWLPQIKKLLYLAKVLILPQALTAGSLWALLRYLLKDADLLDAQRDRLGRGEEACFDDRIGHDGASLAARAAVHMLPCGHACDIERISASRDGGTVVTAGLDNSIALWRFADTAGTGTREMLKLPERMRSSAIVAVAVCPEGRYVAAASRQGLVQIWRVGQNDSSKTLPLITTRQDSKRLIAIQFDSATQILEDPFRAPTQQIGTPPRLVMVYGDGTVLAVPEPDTIMTLHEAGESDTRTLLLRTDDEDDMALLAFGHHGQSLIRRSEQWRPVPLDSHSAPGDRITAISAIRHQGQDTSLIAIGRHSGLVEIFDVSSGELAGSIGQSQHLDRISRVDLAPPLASRCTGCGTTSSAGFIVVSSSGDQVYVDRLIPPNTLICRCSVPRRSIEDVNTRPYLSRSPSDGVPVKTRSTESLVVPPCSARARLSPSSSPRRSPSLLPPTSNGEFPLSSHGTRKLSAYQPYDSSNMSTPISASHGNMPTAATSVGYVAVEEPNQIQTQTPAVGSGWTDMEILPFGAVLAPSGTWTIVSDTIVGLRRSSSGIGHDQWQIWTIDLTAPYNGSVLNVDTSSLADLEEETRQAVYESITDDHGGIPTNVQRAERLHSISGRATFPSIRGSFSVPTFPTLAYVDIRTIATKGDDSVVVGFGNQLGVITVPPRQSLREQASTAIQGLTLGPSVQRTPRSRLGSSSGMDRRAVPTALGLTPPPPRKVSEDRKAV